MILDFNEFDPKMFEADRIVAAPTRVRTKKAQKVEIPGDKKDIGEVEYDREGNIKSYTHGREKPEDSEYLTKKAEKQLEKDREMQAHLDSLFGKYRNEIDPKTGKTIKVRVDQDAPPKEVEPLFKGTEDEIRSRAAEKEKSKRQAELGQQLHNSTELKNAVLGDVDPAATILTKQQAVDRQNSMAGFKYDAAHPGTKREDPQYRSIAQYMRGDEFSHAEDDDRMQVAGMKPAVAMINCDKMLKTLEARMKYLHLTDVNIIKDDVEPPSFAMTLRFQSDFPGGKSARMAEEYLGAAGHLMAQVFGKFYIPGDKGMLAEPPRMIEGTKVKGPEDLIDSIDQTFVIRFRAGYTFKLVEMPEGIVKSDEMAPYLERILGESVVLSFNQFVAVTERLHVERAGMLYDAAMEFCCTGDAAKRECLLIEDGDRMAIVTPAMSDDESRSFVSDFERHIGESVDYVAFNFNGRLNIMIQTND